MSIPFDRTMRLLARDTHTGDVRLLAAGGALLALWAAWLVCARVPVYEVSREAHLAAGGAPSPIESPIPGRAIGVHLLLGQRVRAGDVLVELDATAASLALAQRERELEGLSLEHRLLGAELAKERALSEQETRTETIAAREARARHDEAQLASAAAADEAQRAAILVHADALTPAELTRARLEAGARDAAAEALRLAAARVELRRLTASSEGALRVDRLGRRLATLWEQIAAARIAVERARTEVERHRVRAPASGTLGEVADLRPGAVVAAGEKLALVVPERSPTVVAEVDATAVGRVRPGQGAIVKLDAFPWTQYGVVHARVVRVGSEAHRGAVRTELAIDRRAASGTSIPLQHGLAASVEIAVEDVAPITLVVRRLASWTAP